MRYSALLSLLTLALVSCQTKPEKTCQEYLKDKKQLDSIAKSVIEEWRANPDSSPYQIWNLGEADTSHVTYYEDYFTNPKTKNTLVLMQGEAGLSAGSAHNLLMLFDCSAHRPGVLWAGQFDEFTPTNIRDLNGDGIKEISTRDFTTWMGECSETFAITNFKDNKRNTLYAAHSFSVFDCGSDDSSFTRYTLGDTLTKQVDAKILPLGNGKFRIRQITTSTLFDGKGTVTQLYSGDKWARDTVSTPTHHSVIDTSYVDLK